MALITLEKNDGIAFVTMCSEGNRHNLDFSKEMNLILDQVAVDPSVSSMILASSDPKNFSLGIDVDWIGKKFQDQAFDEIKEFMFNMNSVFKKLLLLPVPAIAAISGHAFGNGAIISCACDFRFMRSDRGFFCFPEVDLGIPFLPGMLAFVKKAIPRYKFNEMYLTGKRTGAPELFEHHVIEKACADTEELMMDTVAFAKTFAKKKGIFGEMKKRLHKDVVAVLDNEDPPVIESLKLFITD
jgi:enoyl-CoA hydratase/carnithine racemase